MKKICVVVLAVLLPFSASALRLKKQQVVVPQPIEVVDSLEGEGEEEMSLDDLDARQDSLESNIHFEWRNDTLYVNMDEENLPSRLYVVANGQKVNVFKHLRMDTANYPSVHPAAEVYGGVWMNERVNPYKVPIDSMRDSIAI